MSQLRNKKTLIVDLSNTALYFSKLEIAQSAPYKVEFARYCFQTGQSFTEAFNTLEKKAYQALEILGSQPIGDPDNPRACDKSLPYPQFFCDMMLGKYTEKEGLALGLSTIKLAAENGLFVSELEKNLVQEVIKIMFSSSILIRCCKPHTEIIDYLYQLSLTKDTQGEPQYQLFVLSNLQKEVFDAMKTYSPLKKLFQVIPLEHWIISSEVHMIKPHRDIFEYVINTFALTPQECFFLDDQPENIEMANKLGIHGTLYDHNFSVIKTQLNQYFNQ